MRHIYGDVSNLNAPYDGVYSNTYGVHGLGQAEGADHPLAPWRQYSPNVQTMQKQLNELLLADGGCPLLADGIIGPRTCGALQHYGRGGEILFSTCAAHQAEEPWVAPTIPCPAQAPAPISEEEPELVRPSTGSGIPSWAIGVGLGALAIGVALVLKKKKGRR